MFTKSDQTETECNDWGHVIVVLDFQHHFSYIDILYIVYIYIGEGSSHLQGLGFCLLWNYV